MANTVTNTKLIDGPTKVVMLSRLAYVDTANQTDTVLVDVSALNPFIGTGVAPTKLRVRRILGITNGCSAKLEFDADTDDLLAALPDTTSFDMDFREYGGLIDPASTGTTGDITITTTNFTASGDAILVLIEAEKVA